MATLSLTATFEPSAEPTPRVRLDVSDTGLPAIASVVVLRRDADGRVREVRTSDAGPLPLSGGIATVYDYEAPFGTAVTYYIEHADATNTPEATGTLAATSAWLIHPGVPSRSRPVRFRVGTNVDESWDLDQGVFPVLERETPVVVTGGARLAPASKLLVRADNPGEKESLRLLLSDGAALLLNVDPALNIGLPTAYIAVGSVRPRRRSEFGHDGAWVLEAPYQVVDRPAGGTQAAIIWDDVATQGADEYTAAAGSQYMTWQEIADAGVSSWAELAAPTT